MLNRRNFVKIGTTALVGTTLSNNVFSAPTGKFTPEPFKLSTFQSLPDHKFYEGKLIDFGYYPDFKFNVTEDCLSEIKMIWRGWQEEVKDDHIYLIWHGLNDIPVTLGIPTILDGKLGVVFALWIENNAIYLRVAVPDFINNRYIEENKSVTFYPTFDRESGKLKAISYKF